MPTAFEEKKIRHASGDSSKSIDSLTNYIPQPPDGGYGWVIVLASFLNHVLVDGISFSFGIFYLEFMEYFEASSSKTALVGSLLVGTYLMTGPIASGLINKFGCRPVCVVGGVIAVTSFFLSTFSTNINQLMITYGVLAGFGFGLVYLPSIISVSYYFEKRRALATGIAVCGSGVGAFVFAPLCGFLLDKYSWQNALLAVAGLVIVTCLNGALMKPLKPTRELPKPREKNVIDRLMESTKSKLGLQRSDSIYSTRTQAKVNEKVMEMKRNREKLVREELGESEPNSVLSSSCFSHDPSRLPSRSCSLVDRAAPHDLAGLRIANGEIHVPQIVLENGEDGLGEAGNNEGPGDNEALLQEIAESSAKEVRTPIFKPAPVRSNSDSGKQRDLQVMLLQKKLQAVQQQNGTTQHGRALESAPSLVHHSTRLAPLQPAAKPLEFHSDVCVLPAMRQRKGHDKADYARPMYRKDIFYSGSVYNVTEFQQSQQDMGNYLKSVTSIPEEVPPEARKCSCLPKVFTDVIKQMCDLSILRDPVFIIACLANMLGFLGIFVPFVFIADRAMSLGVSKDQAALLLSVIGLTNTIGRVISGLVADFKCINTLALHNVAIILAGALCLLNSFCTTFPLMCAFAACFGLCFAAWISLTSIVLVELMGMERLTNAFGLLTLVRGICSVIGAPVAGIVYDLTKNYDIAFHVGGVLLILTGLLFSLLHLPCMKPKKVDSPSVVAKAEVVVIDIKEGLLRAADKEEKEAPLSNGVKPTEPVMLKSV